jgi:hypothetical protein
MVIESKGQDDPVAVVGAPLLALAVYSLSYTVAAFVAKMALGVFWYSLPINTAQKIICSLAAMSLARYCCDVVLKIYSKRGPFIIFLCVGVFMIAGFLMGSLGHADPLQFQLEWPVFTIAAAYWWFCYDYSRRRPFILFLCVAVCLIALSLLGGGDDNPLLLQLAWPAFTIAAAHWRFRRGRASLSQPAALQSVEAASEKGQAID